MGFEKWMKGWCWEFDMSLWRWGKGEDIWEICGNDDDYVEMGFDSFFLVMGFILHGCLLALSLFFDWGLGMGVG